MASFSFAQTEQKEELDLATADLGEIDLALNNPLTFQNNTSTKTGDAVDGTEYGIDPNRIASGGYSAGAVSSLMLGADAIDGASAKIGAIFSIASGLFGMESEIDSSTPGVFILHGTEDHVIPYAVEIGSLKAALKQAGVAFESHIVEGSTHATVQWDLIDSPVLYRFMIKQLGSPTKFSP